MHQPELWRAVLDQPDDDLPRLIYADWLEEQAEPLAQARAEFIRVQIERHHLSELLDPTPEQCERLHQLLAEERRYLARYRGLWTAHLPNWARGVVTFERGWPEILSCSVRLWLEAGHTLTQREPIRWLSLTGAAGWGMQLAHCKALRTIRGCDFVPRTTLPDSPMLRALACSTELGSLRRLALGRANYDPEAMAELMDSPNFQRLHVCKISTSSSAIESIVRHLAEHGQCPELRRLKLQSVYLDESALEPLAYAEGLPNLEELDLSGCRLSPRAVFRIGQSARLPRLRRLLLTGNLYLGDAVLRELARTPLAERLEWLAVDSCGVSDAGVRWLLESKRFVRLRRLTVDLQPPTLRTLAETLPLVWDSL